MIYGLGMDLVELNRIAQAQAKRPQFASRILTAKELDYYHQIKAPRRQVEFLAGRFAVKEAFAKAYGTGIGKAVSFLDLEILNHPITGKPEITQALFHGKVHLSITHTQTTAAAVVILEEG